MAEIFEYGERHNFLRDVSAVDYQFLRHIRNLVSGREVGARTIADFQQAMLTGFDVFNRVRESRGGRLRVDLHERTLELL